MADNLLLLGAFLTVVNVFYALVGFLGSKEPEKAKPIPHVRMPPVKEGRLLCPVTVCWTLCREKPRETKTHTYLILPQVSKIHTPS